MRAGKIWKSVDRAAARAPNWLKLQIERTNLSIRRVDHLEDLLCWAREKGQTHVMVPVDDLAEALNQLALVMGKKERGKR